MVSGSIGKLEDQYVINARLFDMETTEYESLKSEITESRSARGIQTAIRALASVITGTPSRRATERLTAKPTDKRRKLAKDTTSRSWTGGVFGGYLFEIGDTQDNSGGGALKIGRQKGNNTLGVTGFFGSNTTVKAIAFIQRSFKRAYAYVGGGVFSMWMGNGCASAGGGVRVGEDKGIDIGCSVDLTFHNGVTPFGGVYIGYSF